LLTKFGGENFGFHFHYYDFDSAPEKEFFEKILNILKVDSFDVEDIYFTGSMNDPKKTDFHFEYKGVDGNYHEYYPDFVLVKKNGEFIIVEIKAENERTDEGTKAKAEAVRKISGFQENAFKYVIIYTDNDIGTDNLSYNKICEFIKK
jgi:hypothetical protein